MVSDQFQATNKKVQQNSSYSGLPQFLLLRPRRRSLEVSAAIFIGIAFCCLFLYRSLYDSSTLMVTFPPRLYPRRETFPANWPEISSPTPDADIMWLRNPFPHFHKSADFQIACDRYSAKSPTDRRNNPNGGFTFVRSNVRTLQFYRFWYYSRQNYPKLHDQDVLNKIKFHPFINSIGLQMRFLDTARFGGFCEPAKDLNVACTMHANCCVGLKHKIHDLNVVLQDWKHFLALPRDSGASRSFTWRAPQRCRV
ncbi:Uncharacterized protein At4g15970 [Linum grandiflorum]